MLFSIKNLHKSYSGNVLLDGVSLMVNDGNKIALVGKNGIGKSTLLRMLVGKEIPDSGNIIFAKDKTVKYLPQELLGGVGMTPLEYIKSISPDVKDHLIFSILNGLGLSNTHFNHKLEHLSGGQKTKILLANFLLEKGDVLLLDEPTNNLDMQSLIWLETFLKNSKKTMIIVSHDIEFLNNICNKVVEIKYAKFITSGGTYSDYIERIKKQNAKQLEEYKRQQIEIYKLESQIKKTLDRSREIDSEEHADADKLVIGALIDKASKTQARTSRQIKMKLRKMKIIDKPFDEEIFNINIKPRKTDGNLDIELDNVVAGYESTKLPSFSFTLNFGSRVCFIGANGIGKSTLIQTILKKQKAVSGEIKSNEGIMFGDLMQEHQRLDPDSEIKEFFINETKASEERTINTLKKYGLSEGHLKMKIKTLSPGMRARILFAIFEVLSVNVLVLDEPTNHLDMDAVDALKKLLNSYTGSVILISHNRDFLTSSKIDTFFEITSEKINRVKDFEEYVKESQKQAEKNIERLKRVISL